ncbi:ABC transporter ATP-binding protein [Phytohabitans sp. ZYX-F-186]|uniref:ABC transporter ATP-binding protein n=1 Tax=Phytohabitans maris TaxID=3071409 RepID=A0ABU0ZPY2_9ACTN|nr:ABC transporter ATP-binding protein [Phytohabitans sp. ZYX-F-186]MDQ7908796.1 ABC transporter ATP-binding protein [Phytohabitans sp. ZYX-F-186]
MSALLPTASAGGTWAAVRDLLRGRRLLALGALAVLVTATAAGLLTAPLLGRVVDIVASGRPASAVTWPIVLIVGAAVVQGGLTALGVTLVAQLGEGMLAELRERFVSRALRLPLERVERAGSGDLTARVTADVSIVAEAVRRALPQLARSVLAIALTLVALAVLDWRFFVAALLAVPIQAHTVRWYVRHAVPLYAAQRVSVGAQQQQLLDTVGGAATVRAFRLGDHHVERVTERSTATVTLALRAVRLITRFYGRLNLAEYAGLSAVLAAGFLLVRADAVTIGTATAAALYFHNLFGPINIALSLVDDAQVAAAGLARLVGVASLPPVGEAEAERPVAVEASVKAAGLGHAYLPGHLVLRDVDLHIAPGERVALVGASGAGKTTVAKLVAGVHRPSHGTVHIAGVAVEELGAAATGGLVALITQEVHVFAGRLADDLRLARPDASDERVREALARVGALAWARALPDGLDTVVGEGGHQLTVTQAQQLALARLVLADPPVAVLDEATADAGSAGARVLEESAARALDGRTGLVVAHRLTQAATADRVVVLDAGRVVESGPHAVLVEAGGAYARLWTAWSATRGG